MPQYSKEYIKFALKVSKSLYEGRKNYSRDITQQYMADRIGVTREYINKVENLHQKFSKDSTFKDNQLCRMSAYMIYIYCLECNLKSDVVMGLDPAYTPTAAFERSQIIEALSQRMEHMSMPRLRALRDFILG